ncbi:MAG: DEAD/DEAH box helicase family protein [Candidatus Micrarchaeota archaeon]|nr:DEAD/DEAH box helicase family protein [Candidatus Micrarchaeota archaeon]
MEKLRKREPQSILGSATRNLAQYIDDRTRNSPDRFTKGKDDAESKEERQLVILENTLRLFESGQNRGYVNAITGFGKSYMIKEYAVAVNPKRMLIVTHSNVGVNQKEEEFTSGERVFDVGIINKDKHEYGRHITITTYSSLLAGISNYNKAVEEAKMPALPMHVKGVSTRVMIDPKDYDFVALDEVHKSLGQKTFPLIKEDFSKDTIIIGYTATPKYHPGKQVAHLLHNKIDEINGIESSRKGWTSSFKVIYAVTTISLDDVEMTRNNTDYSMGSLQKAINTAAGNMAALELYQYPEFIGRQCLIFCAGVKHSKEVAKLFRKNGIVAEAIYGNMTTQERNRILNKFKEGKIAVLANADLLREEFNHDSLEVVFNLRPMRSEVAVLQRGGRSVRIDKNNPMKFARIVEFLYLSELPFKTQVTFDEAIKAPYIARNKEIMALMSAEQFRIEHNQRVSVVPAESQKRVPPTISALRKVIVDPLEIIRIQRERTEKRLDAKFMPENFTPFDHFLKSSGINRHYALDVIKAYRKDKAHSGMYIVPETGLTELCISNTLKDRIARMLPVSSDYEPVILVAKDLGWKKSFTVRKAKELFGDDVVIQRKLGMYEKPESYLSGEIADALRKDNASD